ncbi:hypothetical protein L1887_35594 [Cichorium endivia]|nr:hypothetical protein L1887_35594 [Cichorium endivia]
MLRICNSVLMQLADVVRLNHLAVSIFHLLNSLQSQNSQVTQQMQVPLSYVDVVIGTAGSNISYIRRASGATIITVQETKGVPGEMTGG